LAFDKEDSLQYPLKGTVFKVKFANDKVGQGKQVELGKPFQVIPDKTYEITAQKNGYLNYSLLFSTSYDTKSDSLKLEFQLKKLQLQQETTVDAIYFESNSSKLKPASKQSLNKLFKTLLANPSLRIEIGGHTDSEGSTEYNLALSQKRAQAVVDYLINLGIGTDVLTAKGYGDTKPVTEEKKSELNRRIEYKITDLNNIDDEDIKQED
jgi:outer membrane protein OmpA-like peptidoglycan-associated protein